MRVLPEQRVVFVTGKGGVGKSTVAALLAEQERAHSGSATLVEFEDSAAARRALGPDSRVDVVLIEYTSALLAALAPLVKSQLLARVIVNQRSLRRVLNALPAIRELAALERIRQLRQESAGRVFVDLPATGHGIDWLRVPEAAARFLRSGPLAEMCRGIQREVIDARRSAIVVVATAEPVVASETRELCERLAKELGRRPQLVVANRVPASPDSALLVQLEGACERQPDLHPLLAMLADDHERSQLGERALEALLPLADQTLRLPELFRDPLPADLLPYLGALA